MDISTPVRLFPSVRYVVATVASMCLELCILLLSTLPL